MEFRDYLRILRKSWMLIMISLLLGIGVAAGYSLLQTPQYAATSKVFVSTQSGDSTSELLQGSSFTQQRVKTYVSVVQTPIVLEPVIADLGLTMSVKELGAQIDATAPVNETLINITVTDSDPELATRIANTVPQSLSAAVADIETLDTGESEESAASPVKLTVVQEAAVPGAPVSPNVPLNLALGVFVGLAFGLGVAVLREMLDTRVRNEHDLAQLTDLPILGGIPFDTEAAAHPLIVQDDPSSHRAESFRVMRTNLQFVDVGQSSRVFVITSSIAGEGKSSTATNLAIAVAAAGARVLLVDADLRRPRVSEYLGIEGSVGLTDLLIGRAKASDVVQRIGSGGMYALPAGRIPPNPSELLGSAKMREFAELVARQFDIVIYDAPPLLPVTDAALLSRSVGSAIVMVAAGRTRKNQLVGALTSLQNVDAPIAGLVLTMMPTKGPDSYGYGRYGYGYGYGEAQTGSGSEREVKKAARERERARKQAAKARPRGRSGSAEFVIPAVGPLRAQLPESGRDDAAERAAGQSPVAGQTVPQQGQHPVAGQSVPQQVPAPKAAVSQPDRPQDASMPSGASGQSPAWEDLFNPTEPGAR